MAIGIAAHAGAYPVITEAEPSELPAMYSLPVVMESFDWLEFWTHRVSLGATGYCVHCWPPSALR